MGVQQKGLLTASYLAGLIFAPYWGWALGTTLGATATSLLPMAVPVLSGYRYLWACLLPSSFLRPVEAKPITVTIILAVLLSCGLSWLPVVSGLSSGWRIILCAVIASAYAAYRFPVREEAEEQ